MQDISPAPPLRSGWTTGACATAASVAAFYRLCGQAFPDPVQIMLPGGQSPAFPLAFAGSGCDDTGPWAVAGIIKDAGDDPDVTHGALILAELRPGKEGSGLRFQAGSGVGTITLPGLPLPVGEPAINPGPRAQISENLQRAAQALSVEAKGLPDLDITISIPGGEELAQRTWNPRLGILGGLSVLGTTGIVRPFSCSAWIHSIHRGIDVARATGLTALAGCTGSTSEAAVRKRFPELGDQSFLDMGDFAGAVLKYLTKPLKSGPKPDAAPGPAPDPAPDSVCRLVLGGGFAKIAKLAQGHGDLHSGRSQLDLPRLATLARDRGAPPALAAQIASSHTGKQALDHAQVAGFPLGELVAETAWQAARTIMTGGEAKGRTGTLPAIRLEILVIDRNGTEVGFYGAEI